MRFLAGTLLTLVTASLLVAQQTVAPGAASVSQTADPSTQSESQAPATPAAPPPPQPTGPGQNTAAPIADSSPQQSSPQQNPAAVPQSQTAATSSDASLPPGTAIIPTVTKREAADAKRQFQAGVKLKSKGHLDAAFDKFCSASELDPRNVDYLTAREFTRQELAMQALKDGNQAMMQQNEIVAMADFRRALEYDSTNDYAHAKAA